MKAVFLDTLGHEILTWERDVITPQNAIDFANQLTPDGGYAMVGDDGLPAASILLDGVKL